MVRVFERWDADWQSANLDEIESSDRLMFLSVRAKLANGTQLSWRDIADAQPGSALHDDMVEWVDRIEAWDGDVWFDFHHGVPRPSTRLLKRWRRKPLRRRQRLHLRNDIDNLATAGVTKGCNPPLNSKFCPDSGVTRAQMAAFLHRALDT